MGPIRLLLASGICVFTILITNDALAASSLRLACTDDHKIPGRALICEYSVLGRSNDELAGLHDKITATGRVGGFDADRWAARRDGCTTVDCLDKVFEEAIREAKAVLASPMREATATPSLASPPVPTVESLSPSATIPSTASAAPEQVQKAPAVLPQEPEKTVQVTPSVPEGYEPSERSAWDSLVEKLTLIAVVAGAIYLVAAIWGFSTRCPECRKWFAEREINRELLDRYTDYETVRRRDERRDSQGRLIDTVYREEQVAVLVRIYDVDYRCKHCDHEWRVREKTKK